MSKSYEPFKRSLPEGEANEDRVAGFLSDGGAFVRSKCDGMSRQDLEVVHCGHVHRVEVKYEDKQCHTGNICIETLQGAPPRPSGIAWSEAQVCIHTLGDDCVLYRRREMLDWVRTSYRGGVISMIDFGDNNNRGFLVKVDDMLGYEWFERIETAGLANSVLWSY